MAHDAGDGVAAALILRHHRGGEDGLEEQEGREEGNSALFNSSSRQI